LSDRTPPSGRLIYGLQLGDFGYMNRPATSKWNDETESRYMEQVRERAQQMARDILAQALAEAERIKVQARSEGLAAGREEAMSKAKAETKRAADFLKTLQQALQDEKARVYEEHKQTLFQILRLAFEKTLGVMLREEREQALHALFDEAVTQLQAATSITVHVSPADLELARALVAQTRESRPDLPELRVNPNPELDRGGVRIESGDGLVDNSISSRFEQVMAILDGYQEHS